jgi:hypothetical protein
MHLALYHPAAALRSTAIKETIVAESATIPAALQDARARRRATTEPPPAEPVEAPVAVEPEAAHDQMNLFR